MRRRWVWLVFALVAVGLSSQIAVAGSSGLFGDRFDVGELIQFRVVDQANWWWGCCAPSCSVTEVYGWRVAVSGGAVVFAVVHDFPVLSTEWIGNWAQVDSSGLPVAAGSYILYVDTSAGTLSRCFRIIDPCCWSVCWWCCPCESVPSISVCECTTTLEWVYPEPECCWPFCCPTCP